MSVEVEKVIVRYDGPALAGHRMDVGDLAPALLGLSELCKIANAKFNGDAATVKVFITVDEEQKCFQFAIDVVQTVMQTVQTYLDHQTVKSAQDLLKFIGLASGTAYGLIKLLKELRGKSSEDVKQIPMVRDGQSLVQITVVGDNNRVYFVYPETAELLKDVNALESAKRVVLPVSREGYDKLEFEENGEVSERVTKDEARAILDVRVAEEPAQDFGEPQEITAFVQVYSPVYDVKAPEWRFLYNGARQYMDISETDIARNAIQRGAAAMNDTYKVRLEMQQTRTATGKLSARYKIKEVLEFLPASIQVQRDFISDASSSAEPPLPRDE